jgi:hypothetical protein
VTASYFAKGVVNVNGTVYSNMNIAQAVWDATAGRWCVYFREGNYNVYDHTTMITPLGLPPLSPPLAVGYDQGGPNAVCVAIYDSVTGAPVMHTFSIIVLPPE